MANISGFVKVFVVDCLQGLDYGGQVKHLPVQQVLIETNYPEPGIVFYFNEQPFLQVRVAFLNRFSKLSTDILK